MCTEFKLQQCDHTKFTETLPGDSVLFTVPWPWKEGNELTVTDCKACPDEKQSSGTADTCNSNTQTHSTHISKETHLCARKWRIQTYKWLLVNEAKSQNILIWTCHPQSSWGMATAVLCPLSAYTVTVLRTAPHLSAVLLSLQGGSSHPAAIACAFQDLLGICHEVSILNARLTVMANEFITMMLKWKPCDSLAVTTLTLLHTAQVWCSDSFKKLQQQKKKTKGKYLAGYSFCLSQAVINKNISNFPDKQ